MKRTVPLLAAFAAFAFVLGGCASDSPVQTDPHMHPGGISFDELSKSTDKETLDALRKLIDPFHELDAALAAGYGLLVAPPATAPDGCISDMREGGMGYHYTRGNNLADDSVALLDPEFIVYAPKDRRPKDGQVRRRLAALEFFLPFSPKWPAPTDPAFKHAPTLHNFSTMRNLPNLAFAPTTRFGGWMFHIWMFEENPHGEFANWNRAVPLCQGSTF